MGKKMNRADIHHLEQIEYDRDDEISSLVDAYNRMVKDLSESTKKLAQAERDKAWSQMARQVAHEIKNPLTPIKLQIQRLIRLKQNNNPAWEERFDEVSAVVLEHIDILTETANEFSTFAKLYSEEPVLLDLDKTIKDQLLIFDNKDNVKISYLGLEEAYVMAPKPQLIRVFVNLITNAIQAVEISQKDSFGIISLLFFIGTVIWLILNVERCFNLIWKAERGRSIAKRFLYYFGILIVAPLVVTMFLSVTLIFTRIIAGYLIQWVAFYGVIAVFFTILYKYVPNVKVKFSLINLNVFVNSSLK